MCLIAAVAVSVKLSLNEADFAQTKRSIIMPATETNAAAAHPVFEHPDTLYAFLGGENIRVTRQPGYSLRKHQYWCIMT